MTSFSFDPATGQRGAGFPAPGSNMPSSYSWDGGAWNPGNVESDDPHDGPLDVVSGDGVDFGDDNYGDDGAAVASNIVVDDDGQFSR